MDNTTELWMTKYIIGEISSSGRATLYKNPSDQTVICMLCYVGVVVRSSRSVGNMYEMHKEETHLHFDDYYEDGALHGHFLE